MQRRFLRSLLLLMACCASIQAVQADCAGGGLSIWPVAPAITPDQLIIIDAYGSSQPLALGMGSIYAPCLVAGGDRVPLDVVEVCVGEDGTSQAVLHPRRSLVPGYRYRLMVGDIGPAASPMYKVMKDGRGEGRSYYVDGPSDTRPPEWLSPPTLEKVSHEMLGCGDEVYAVFKVATSEPHDAYVRAEARPADSTEWMVFYLPVIDGRVQVGHGMCGGPFAFRAPGGYEARFTLLDASGNASVQPGAPVPFVPPVTRPSLPTTIFKVPDVVF